MAGYAWLLYSVTSYMFRTKPFTLNQIVRNMYISMIFLIYYLIFNEISTIIEIYLTGVWVEHRRCLMNIRITEKAAEQLGSYESKDYRIVLEGYG